MIGAGRGSRRRFLTDVGRVVGGAVAASFALSRARPAFAIGERSLFRFARLALPGLPDPRPTALRRLAWEIVRRTSVATASTRRRSGSAIPTCSAIPFLVLSGDRRFALPSEVDIARLRRHITYGGFLLIDSAEGRAGGGFDDSVRRLLAQTLPGELPIRIPDSHVLWKSFYVLRGAPGRTLARRSLEGVEREPPPGGGVTRRTILGGALARDGFGRWEHEVVPGGDDQREEAVPSRRQPGDVRALPRLQDRAGAHRLHPAHAAAAAVTSLFHLPGGFNDWRLALGATAHSGGWASRCCSSAPRWPSRCRAVAGRGAARARRRCCWPARARACSPVWHARSQPAIELRQVTHAAQPRGGAGRRVTLDGGAAARRRPVARRARRGDARARGAALGRLAAGGHEVDLFSFGETLAPATPASLREPPAGDATRIGEALADVRARYAGATWARRSSCPTASTPAASVKARSTAPPARTSRRWARPSTPWAR
jgi:hypothetical protein